MDNIISQIDADNHTTIILSAFKKLIDSLSTLSAYIQTELIDLPLHISDGQGGFSSDRAALCKALMFFQPGAAASPQETVSWQGAVAADEKTFRLIDEINAIKDHFKLVIQQSKPFMPKAFEKYVRNLLAQAGYGLVKLKPVYRHIFYLNFYPQRISWSKAKDYSYKKVTIEETKSALLKAGQGSHIDVQLLKLSRLSQSEKLVIMRKIRPYWIVNISYLAENKLITSSCRTSLPLFYLPDPLQALPKVLYSKKSTRIVRHRADKKIEEEPYLSSICVYRYKENIKMEIEKSI